MNEMVNERQMVERLAEEFVERHRAGERPSLDEYVAAHPQHADEIRDLFPALILIEELAPHEDSSAGATGAPAVAAAAPLARVGDFRILREVGRGGMGIVYEAEQEALGRRVALKVLPVQLGQDPRILARFRRESRAAAQLHHSNIVPVFEVGQEAGVCYYAMQFIRGQALDQVFRELQCLRASSRPGAAKKVNVSSDPLAQSLWTGEFKPADGADATLAYEVGAASAAGAPQSLSAGRPSTAALPDRSELSSVTSNYRLYCRNVARLGMQAADALAYAHGRGIIHRDIKPANLLLDTTGVLWVSDFGLAKTQDIALTETGDLLGTLRYMAPERFKGECDPRADVYALGLTLYELLVLRPAFDGTDRLHLVEQIGRQEPARLRTLDSRIPRDLETIIMTAIEKDPRRRYASADAMAGDLRRFLADEPIQARRIGLVERLGRWGRKNPLVASLSAAIVLVATVGFLGVFGQLQVAVAHEQQAKQKEQEANQQRDEVKALNAKLERILYAAHINLAQRAWDEADVRRVLTLLDQHRPKGGEPDLRGFEWHYLHRLCKPENVLSIDGAWGGDVAFSPDGTRVFGIGMASVKGKDGAVAGYDPQLRAFDAWTGKELSALTLKGGGNNRPFLSSNGEYVVLAPDTKTVNVWNVQTGKQVSINRNAGGGPLILSPDGKRLAGRSGREIVVWDSQTGQELRTLKGHADPVLGLTFSHDGKRLASNSGTRDKQDKFVPGEVKVWDVETGKEIVTIKALADPVWTLSFSADGNRLLTASDAEAKMWEVKTGKELFSLKAQSEDFSAVRLSPDGQRLVTSGQGSSKMPGVVVWDAKTGHMIFALHGAGSHVFHIAFSQDGKHMATLGSDQTARIWNLQTGEEVATLRGIDPRAGGIGMAFSPDGNRLALAGGGPSVPLKVWDWDAQKNRLDVTFEGISILRTGISGGNHVLLSPDFKHVAGVSGTTVKVWDAQTAKEITTLKGLANAIFCVAFSPDGTRVAASGGAPLMGLDAKRKAAPGVVKIWDAKTGKELLSLEGHTDSVPNVAFSVDGKRLASAAVDGTVKVWDAYTGKELFSFNTKNKSGGFIGGLAFSPDVKRIIANGGVWDAQTGKELLSVASLPSVTFTPDGNRLVSRSGLLMVWDAQTSEQLFPPKGEKGTMVGRQGESSTTAFSPDGKRLAVATTDQVKIYDVQTWQELLSLKAPHASRSRFLAFSPDGHRLGLVTGDGTLTIWDATPLPEKRSP